MQEGWVMVLEFFLTVIIMIDIIIRLVAEGKVLCFLTIDSPISTASGTSLI
jgi:hypothetical protein